MKIKVSYFIILYLPNCKPIYLFSKVLDFILLKTRIYYI